MSATTILKPSQLAFKLNLGDYDSQSALDVVQVFFRHRGFTCVLNDELYEPKKWNYRFILSEGCGNGLALTLQFLEKQRKQGCYKNLWVSYPNGGRMGD